MSINSVVHVLYGMHDLIINFNKVTTLLLKLLSENEIRKEFMMLNTEFKPCIVFCCWWHIENIYAFYRQLASLVLAIINIRSYTTMQI